METIKVHIFAKISGNEKRLTATAHDIGGRFYLPRSCYDKNYESYPTSNWKPQFDTALHRALKSREVLA